MANLPLLGRRIHISGSISTDPAVASTEDVAQARELIAKLVPKLVKLGATFVVPVDAEKRRADGQPICFDWLVWQALHESILHVPRSAVHRLAVAVQHHKSASQIPVEYEEMWDKMHDSTLVQIENVSHWNMNCKRLEAQSKYGDILITLGGTDGVLYLANLYHDAGKPVIPLNAAVNDPGTGSLRLFGLGLTSDDAPRLFQAASRSAHDWINRINFRPTKSTTDRVDLILELIQDLVPPRAFGVRLLDPKHPDYAEVQNFFDVVVKPVVEGEFGYRLTVIDEDHEHHHARIDQEIFSLLHRSSVVIADLTGSRPNCFIELGYAFGRQLPTMVTALDGTDLPFDIKTFSGRFWNTSGTAESRKLEFKKHWNSIRTREPLVPIEPLVS